MEASNKLIEDFYTKGIDFSKLPYDCVAAAAERIRRDYHKKGTVSSKDVRIVLGDPCRGVTIPTNEEDAQKLLEESLENLAT